MSTLLVNGETRDLSIAAGGSLLVASTTGTFSATVIAGSAAGTVLATNSTSDNVTFGPYATGAVIRIAAGINSKVVYDTGASPVLDVGAPATFTPDGTALVGPDGRALPTKYYAGLIANRCAIPSSFASANKQLMSRSKHIAMENMTGLSVLFSNWYANATGGEQTPGSASTISVSIEYPVGTITRATFLGAFSGVVSDGANIISDFINISISKGAAFYVRIWHSNASGILYHQNFGANNVSGSVPNSGEWVTFGATTPDLTNSIANSNNQQTGLSFRPTAIIGITSRQTFAIFGDSRCGLGVAYDAAPNSFGLIGEIERSLGKSYATILLSVSGETASAVSGTAATKRIALAQYCSSIVSNYGINDCAASIAAVTTIANLSTFASKLGNKPFYQCTLSPSTSSTDSFATTVNQTTNATVNPIRVAFNNLLRNGLGGVFSGHIELADQAESARDSGLWKVNGLANGYTADGLHANSTGNLLIENSNAFNSVIQP